MKFKNLTALAAASAVLLSGCATSYGRQNDTARVYFKTQAPQAAVSCDSQATELPGNLDLKQSENHDCSARAPGYETLDFRIWSRLSKEGFRYSTRTNWNKWAKWTLGLGLLAAWPVDLLSGSMKTLESDHFDLNMRPASQVSKKEKMLDKTVTAAIKIASVPADITEKTTEVVLDTAIKTPAEAMGLASEKERKEAEQLMQGQAIAEHYQPQS